MRRNADLHPALGLPTEAGPCYLAERVDKMVPNLKLKKHLIEEIEAGGKEFDGRDERIVYNNHKERGPGDSVMELVPHIQRRMDERGMTVNDLRMSLQNWLEWFNRQKAMQTPASKRIEEEMARNEKIVWDDPKLKLTLVFQRPNKKLFIVVTGYWTGSPDPKPPGSCGIKTSSRIRDLALKIL